LFSNNLEKHMPMHDSHLAARPEHMDCPDSTVYVVDDDAPVLRAVSRLLRLAGFHVETFSSPRRFLDHHDSAAASCLVLDLSMPDLNGLEVQQTLLSERKPLPIIFLTGNADVPTSVSAMKQGASDFLTKPVERDVLVQAVNEALAKDKAARQANEELAEFRRCLATLTPREYEVLGHVISGKLNKQTAAEVGAAEKTIKVHRGRIMSKMKVQSVAELVRLAERAGVMPASLEPQSAA
jgi:FixJ family two-component response regulator